MSDTYPVARIAPQCTWLFHVLQLLLVLVELNNSEILDSCKIIFKAVELPKVVKPGSQACWEPISKHDPKEPVSGFWWRLLPVVLEGCKFNMEI